MQEIQNIRKEYKTVMTITEIAKIAGVSTSTVSKIINNKDDSINPQTRKRVLQIVKDYNYTPYQTVKSISSSKKFLIGVLLRSTSQSGPMISGILQTAQEHGYSILLLDSKNHLETEKKNIAAFCSNNVDGIIWEPVSEESYSNMTFLERQNIPACFINGFESQPFFCIDFKQMGYFMAQKLIDYKHTKLACLLKEDDLRSKALCEGFQECLYHNQIPDAGKSRLYISEEDCCQYIINHHITGLVSSDYMSALTLYEQMNKLHYNMPLDYSLVSLKDELLGSLSYPRISGLEIPYYAFGQHVAQHLIQLSEKTGGNKKESYLFMPTIEWSHEDSLDFPASLRPRRFVVVGAINLDVTFHVEQLPQYGNTSIIRDLTSAVGGKGVNEAIGVSRLGHEAALIGKIGIDTDAEFIYDLLERENIITQGVYRDKFRPTGKAYIYTESSGESTISILTGANENLTQKDIEEQQYLFYHTDFCLISTEIPIETAIWAAKTAKKHGIQTIIKPAALKSLPAELLEYADIFVPNKGEAAVLCPEYGSVEEQAEFFLERGPGIVIITLGHDGCYLKTTERAKYFSPPNVTAIDTTGGADAFIAALAVYLGEGYPLEKAIRIATYAAGFCVSRQGTATALVDKNTLESYIVQKEAALLE